MRTTEAKSALFPIDSATFVMKISIQKCDLLIMKNGTCRFFCQFFFKVYPFKVSVNFEVLV